jgi:hypothetical protein
MVQDEQSAYPSHSDRATEEQGKQELEIIKTVIKKKCHLDLLSRVLCMCKRVVRSWALAAVFARPLARLTSASYHLCNRRELRSPEDFRPCPLSPSPVDPEAQRLFSWIMEHTACQAYSRHTKYGVRLITGECMLNLEDKNSKVPKWEVKSGVDSSPSSVGEQCTGSDWVGTGGRPSHRPPACGNLRCNRLRLPPPPRTAPASNSDPVKSTVAFGQKYCLGGPTPQLGLAK